ncbi:carbon-monoxide dehydrogenase catalytic subunit [Candidatus Woesearchaeota archaeon]|nr:MAG: carbon-monoxide dehydrogenase catalytic subunit [Candidatus Woesearchaeota archaeon]
MKKEVNKIAKKSSESAERNETWANSNLLKKAKRLVLDRFEAQQPQCIFGENGICCKNCFSGPCRIIPGKADYGVCGATADVIVARNLLRHAGAGATCHTDHAKETVLALYEIAEGRASGYRIKDKDKLLLFAKKLGIKTSGRPIKAIARDLVYEILEDFRRQQGLFIKKEGTYLNWLRIRATKERIKTWAKLGILPVNADAETSHILHQTTMGCDADPVDLLLSVLRIGLVDGYSGLTLATDIQDIIFGTPMPVKSEANLGVLKEDYVNIVVHGHVPILSEKIVEWAKKLNNTAKRVGAKGINVVGVCCTGIEVLMRQGIPIAGHVLQQEMAIATGVCDLMVVDLQCIYPSVANVAQCYHTKIVTTIDYVRIPGAIHIPFEVDKADETAKKIVKLAVDNFKNRKKNKIFIPKEKAEVWAGFSVEAIIEALKKVNSKDPLKPLVHAIKSGDIYGVVGIVGCRNPKVWEMKFHEELTKLLIKRNILVVGTGCWAHAAAQEGLLMPEATEKYAGPRLKKVLKAVGQVNGLPALPPALHMGSCVDNGRIGVLLGMLADYMKVPIPMLPVSCSAPEYMAEKAVAIASFFLALGLAVHINPVPPVTGSKLVTKVLTKDLEEITGGKVLLAETPEKAAKAIIAHIRKKRKELGLRV